MRRFAAALVAFTMMMVSSITIASAQQPPDRWQPDTISRYQALVDEFGWDVPPELADQVITLLFKEIALLHRLDAFIGSTPVLNEVSNAFVAQTPVPHDVLIAALETVDAELASLKTDILAFTTLGPGPATEALDDLNMVRKTALAAAETGIIPIQPYQTALSILLSNGTANRLPHADLGVEFIDLTDHLRRLLDGLEIAELTGASALQRDSAGQSTDPTAPTAVASTSNLILVAAAIAIGILLIVLLRRRRSVSVTADISTTVRQLIGAATEQEVEAIAIAEGAKFAAADGGVLLRTLGPGVRRAGSTQPIVGTELAAPVETGATLSKNLINDSAFDLRSCAVLAVPVIAGGSVVAVLVLYREPDLLFGVDARHHLERLASPVAAALSNVDRLGSMTELALVDDLTSLGNRRRMDRDLVETVDESQRLGAPVAFAMIDVDHFKAFNDTHGHTAGDDALRIVAAAIATAVRGADIVYRYGGEEFSVLLPGATPEEAADVAERVRLAVEAAPIPGEQTQPGGCLTVSVGVSTLPSDAGTSIAERADKALYKAKLAGRNQVILA